MLELYRAQNFIEFLSLVRNSRLRGTKQYSYRQLADKLGYQSPRTLAMVHRGQRTPSLNLVRKLIHLLELTPHEAELVLLLAEKSVAEKKQIAVGHLDEKITSFQNRIKELKFLEEAHQELSFAALVYFPATDLEKVQEILRNFLLEIKEKYSIKSSECLQYRIKVQIYLDTS